MHRCQFVLQRRSQRSDPIMQARRVQRRQERPEMRRAHCRAGGRQDVPHRHAMSAGQLLSHPRRPRRECLTRSFPASAVAVFLPEARLLSPENVAHRHLGQDRQIRPLSGRVGRAAADVRSGFATAQDQRRGVQCRSGQAPRRLGPEKADTTECSRRPRVYPAGLCRFLALRACHKPQAKSARRENQKFLQYACNAPHGDLGLAIFRAPARARGPDDDGSTCCRGTCAIKQG